MNNNPTTCDRPGTLVRQTLKLVQQDKRDLLTLAIDTGVPFHWLRKFVTGKIPSPGANRIQHLFEKLAGRPLL